MKGKMAIMTKPLELIYREVSVPKPEKGAIVAKTLRANVCGSEIHVWCGHHPAKKSGGLGHEWVGKIEKLGENVETDYAGTPIQIGDRIAAVYYITCRKCAPCQRGEFNLCENAYKYYSAEPEEYPYFHTTFSTHYYIHPEQYFYKVPDNVPDHVAASANCAFSQVYFGIEKAGVNYGSFLVIQGAGGLGLYAASIAKEKGATVIIIDGVKARLEQAKRFGADHIIDMNEYKTVEDRINRVAELTNNQGADFGLEVAGVPQAFVEGYQLLRNGGTFVTMGNVSTGRETSIDPGILTRKSVQVLTILRYQPWYLKKSLDFISQNIDKYPYDELFDGHFHFDEITLALEKSSNREVTRASIIIE